MFADTKQHIKNKQYTSHPADRNSIMRSSKKNNALFNSSALYSRHTRLIAGLIISVAGLSASDNALALPTGASVQSGQIAISQTSPNTLVVNQGSNSAIINWQSFDILNGEATRFNQPSANAIALNRITNGNPTQILGTLTANGHLMIVNANGVFFGANSKVDVAGLIASTSDISNDHFNAGVTSGHFAFDKAGNPNASIINKGSITAADG